MSFKNSAAASVVEGLIRTIQTNKDFLSEVDGGLYHDRREAGRQRV